MIIWYLLYGAVAVFFWGLFISVDENKACLSGSRPQPLALEDPHV